MTNGTAHEKTSDLQEQGLGIVLDWVNESLDMALQKAVGEDVPYAVILSFKGRIHIVGNLPMEDMAVLMTNVTDHLLNDPGGWKERREEKSHADDESSH